MEQAFVAERPWQSAVEQLAARLRAAREFELRLTSLVTGQPSLMYRELLLWVLIEYHAGRPTTLKRCYLSLPFAEKNLRRAVKILEANGFVLLYLAEADKRKTIILPTTSLLAKVTDALVETA